MKKPRILIADDEKKMRRILQIILGNKEYDIDLVENGEEAWNLFKIKQHDLVITDLKMPVIDGLKLLNLISDYYVDTPVIVITAYGSVESAVQVLKAGAFDYITKPFENEEIKIVVKKALMFAQLKAENKHLRKAVAQEYEFEKFLGNSESIRNIREMARQVSTTSSTVLIQGESGTGKELLARIVHYNSQRSNKPFIAFNCGALPNNLLESELFGYEKGAFTGAQKRKPGRFEQADKGTIFLDEVGDMSKEAQVKMLRVLEERTFERLGGTETIEVDVRLIAATNCNLKQMVDEGTFRSDLYYRLNIFPINIPSLKDHREDIPLIVDKFLMNLNHQIGKRIKSASPEAMELLCSRSWPGNIRELQNCLERAMILCHADQIEPAHLLFDQETKTANNSTTVIDIPDEGVSLEEVEKQLIEKALEKTEGNQSKAAALLKITRNTFRYRMEKYHIPFNL